MAERYIKVSDLIDELGKHTDIFEMIENTPEADVVEVRHGYWKQNSYCERIFYCSQCNRHIEDATKNPYEYFPYCHCGAKMDGERK